MGCRISTNTGENPKRTTRARTRVRTHCRSADLNNDGVSELLVTNNQADGTGSLFAYERPTHANAPWLRHELATGFTPTPSILPSPGAHSRGAPGLAVAFKVNASDEAKPAILLSGDDAGFVAVLRPRSQSAQSWDYNIEYICNSSGTIGSPSAHDINGDGIVEIIVPYYSEVPYRS